jgi:hypothetical protein
VLPERKGLAPARRAAYSLRASMATVAAANRPPERKIMQQSERESEHIVRRYIREGKLFRENSAAMLGL